VIPQALCHESGRWLAPDLPPYPGSSGDEKSDPVRRVFSMATPRKGKIPDDVKTNP
jgi:hypothetical protein